MDGVILTIGLLASIIAIVHLIIGAEGSKGITEEYTTKSGKKHTAKRDRKDHLV